MIEQNLPESAKAGLELAEVWEQVGRGEAYVTNTRQERERLSLGPALMLGGGR